MKLVGRVTDDDRVAREAWWSEPRELHQLADHVRAQTDQERDHEQADDRQGHADARRRYPLHT